MGSLAAHNPVQLSDGEVRERFVVRSSELAELVAHLREADPPCHALVIGPRGMGKSLLLRRVAVTVGDEPDLAARWVPVLLPEELYAVTSVGELWLAALGQVAADRGDAALAEQHRALRDEPDAARLEALARHRLLAAARAGGRKVLLLAENLDMVLSEQMGGDQSWVLRQALQTEPDLLLLASAVTSFRELEDAGEAFYGFFHRIELPPLDDAEVGALWRRATGVELRDDRAAAVRILTGGNPRLAAELARFTTRPDLSELRSGLDGLIDEYTPYFKANIEALPPVERKVFSTLADIWAPATAAEVAGRARLTSSQASAHLARLVRRGAVQVVDGEPGTRRYELAERLYNLFHLLRRPDGEGRVRALVDILTHLYDLAELERDVWPALVGAGGAQRADTLVASGLHRYLDDHRVFEGLAPGQAAARRPTLDALLADQLDQLGPDARDTLLTRGQLAFVVGEAGDAAGALDRYRALAADCERVLGPDDRDTLTARFGLAHFVGETGDAAGALDRYRALAADCQRALGPDDRGTLIARSRVAYLVGETGDPAGALDRYRAVAADCERVLGPDDRTTLVARGGLAFYVGKTGDPAGALDRYRALAADRERVLGLDDRDSLVARYQLAYYLGATGDPVGAARLMGEVAADCERVLGSDDGLTGDARAHQLRLALLAAPGPPPREVREVRRWLAARRRP